MIWPILFIGRSVLKESKRSIAIPRMAIRLRIQIGWQQSGFLVNQEELDVDFLFPITSKHLTHLLYASSSSIPKIYNYENKIYCNEKILANYMNHTIDVNRKFWSQGQAYIVLTWLHKAQTGWCSWIDSQTTLFHEWACEYILLMSL